MTEKSSQPEQIRRAALKVFSQQGYSGATMQAIAAEAGMSVATVYRFFPGKKELFQSLERPDLDFPDQQEQQIRADILRAALRVFSQKGYAAATMDEIARAVELSKAGVYFYFPSKEALFAASLKNAPGFEELNRVLEGSLRVLEGPLRVLEGSLSRQDAGLESGLIHLAQTYLSLFEREAPAALLKVILSEGVRSPEVAQAFRENIIRRGSENVAGYLKRYVDLDESALALKVQALFGMLFSWGLVHHLLPGGPEVTAQERDRAAEAYVRQFLYGLDR